MKQPDLKQNLARFIKEEPFRTLLDFETFEIYSDRLWIKLQQNDHASLREKYGVDDKEIKKLKVEISAAFRKYFKQSFSKLLAENKVDSPFIKSVLNPQSPVYTLARKADGYHQLSDPSLDIPQILLELEGASSAQKTKEYTAALESLIPIPSNFTWPTKKIVFDKIRLLIHARADVNVQNAHSHTILTALLQPKFLFVKPTLPDYYFDPMYYISTLIEHKADVNTTDASGLTPLHLACSHVYLSSSLKMGIVSKLLAAGAQFNPDKEGIYPSERLGAEDDSAKILLTGVAHEYFQSMKKILLSVVDTSIPATLIFSYLSALVSLKDPVEIMPFKLVPRCGDGGKTQGSSSFFPSSSKPTISNAIVSKGISVQLD